MNRNPSSRPWSDKLADAPDTELENKQRSHEYRVAARREKRNRKADEKKQRKLNATILRRMTRNPEKYNKNAERNRSRAIELERRHIQAQAIRQAQRLAAVHDPSGVIFNVQPVVTLEDGSVVTEEVLRRRQERALQKASGASIDRAESGIVKSSTASTTERKSGVGFPHSPANHQESLMNIDRHAQLLAGYAAPHRSKTQQRKLAKFAPRPTPPKPIIPNDIEPHEGEENWLSLWDLTDMELERRVKRDKKHKAATRKALRVKQQSGKAERRMARDERRRVYRDLKLEWKELREETKIIKSRLQVLEDEESKKIAVYVTDIERQRAMAFCEEMGFTLQNTAGVDQIRPKAMGMKGVEVDFDSLEKGKGRNEVEMKGGAKRIDLSDIPDHNKAQYVSSTPRGPHVAPGDFIELDFGEGQDFQQLQYNHKVRRKLRRAIDIAEARREQLVRDRVIEILEREGKTVPPLLHRPVRPVTNKGHRILDNGKIETAKMERIRSRTALLDFNLRMRVLRGQAREAAIFAGLRKHAEASGRIRPQDPDLDCTESPTK